ncbi:MAG: Pyruvate ferredoxin oxidoreductase, alpha subunit [Parcubacteria group bacterium GW2011_GWA2_47_7]|nr:MAG: Pyruvate ferredoxin oxidoreductase, alpha subunit [Parcubacteria group bacterium GW2011_GWA2_47_7]
MTERKALTGSEVTALAVAQSRPEVIPAYPITPQTNIIEVLGDMVASGKLANCQFTNVDSEYAAIARVIGAGHQGARCFTATSGQGLVYMCEGLHWAAGSRIPIVLANVNRALGPPWNISSDKSDSLSQRDTGFLQLYAASNQEVYDLMLMAFPIAERTCFPVMVCFDGFILSHTKEPVVTQSQEDVDTFSVKRRFPHALDVNDPHSIGASGKPERYFAVKRQFARDFFASEKIVATVGREFEKRFDTRYDPIGAYRMEDAETAVVVLGSTTRLVHEAVDRMRDRGQKVGAIQIRLFRPFPSASICKALKGVSRVIVIDTDHQEVILQEVRHALYGKTTPVFGFNVGVGGVPMNAELFTGIIDEVLGRDSDGGPHAEWRGVPEDVPVQEKVPVIIPIADTGQQVKSGHRGCAGCTAPIVMRHVLKAVGKGAQVALPACCWSIIDGPGPRSHVNVPMLHCPFASAAPVAAGMKDAAKKTGKDITAIAFGGDGGTFDIGFGGLSGVAAQGADIIYVCYDNEAYMNTGGQGSSATPHGAVTETNPAFAPKLQFKKKILQIMAMHGIPYAASASIYHLDDFNRKLAKAIAYKGQGLRFLHVLAPCNTGWKVEPSASLYMAHLAVETKVFPLVECDHGKWSITHRPTDRAMLAEYVKPQGRFAHWTDEDIALAKIRVDLDWEEFEKLEKYF